MSGLMRRIQSDGGYGLPDDDPSIERRYPYFPFVDHRVTRKMQRKCLMMAEYLHNHPEEAARIDRERAAMDASTSGIKPRVATPPSNTAMMRRGK